MVFPRVFLRKKYEKQVILAEKRCWASTLHISWLRPCTWTDASMHGGQHKIRDSDKSAGYCLLGFLLLQAGSFPTLECSNCEVIKAKQCNHISQITRQRIQSFDVYFFFASVYIEYFFNVGFKPQHSATRPHPLLEW